MDNLDFDRMYREKGLAAQRRYPNEPLIQFLAEHYFSIPKNDRGDVRILEVGCGSGANLWAIAKEGFDTYGMDISATALELCRDVMRGYGVEAKLSVGNMQKMDFEDNFFDAIIDVLTIEHTDLKGHVATYREIFRCLKKGGRFFSWHLGAGSVNFKEGGGNRIDRQTIDNAPNPEVPYSNNGLTCFLTPSSAHRMLAAAGFADITIERTVRTYKNMTQKIEYFSIQAIRP